MTTHDSICALCSRHVAERALGRLALHGESRPLLMLTVPAMQVCNRIEQAPCTVQSIELEGRQGIDDAEGGVQERTDRRPKDARLRSVLVQ